jgi:multicomponent Na+:H+ antiporter subunit E
MSNWQANLSWSTLVSRGLGFLSLWWVLTDGTTASWWIGVPAVVLALVTSVALLPPLPFNWLEFVRFVPFFLMRSLLGGVDVAWRAFHPGMPIAPDIIEFPLRLPPGLARVFMVNTVSLLPGTMSTEIGENCLMVHVLDGRKEFFSELEDVEQGVARMFGIFLIMPGGDR